MNESLPILVKDLAYILIVAGVTTVLFKKLRQPLVLGYIVAGFLAGPYMPYTRTIIDTEMVNDWGQIELSYSCSRSDLNFLSRR